jgi:predicted Zn-dependent peptidase
MSMLAANLFPTEAAREFYRDDLGGSLDVVTTYDFIQINATATNDQLLTLLESLSAAVSSTNIDKETTAQLKAAQLAKIAAAMKDPAYVAERAAAHRLFGTFPYGRPQLGTPESVAKIDFADLIDLKQRFLTADNATVAISGNIDTDLAFRASRRYLGSWLKSDKRVPSTFRQPDAPKSGMPIFDSPVANKSEFRYAIRGVARSDKDFYAASLLAHILDRRFKQREGAKAFVRHDAGVLPGWYLFGVSDWNLAGIKRDGATIAVPVTDGYQKQVLDAAVKPEEFDAAARELAIASADVPASDIWLDVDTYKLASAKADREAAQAVTVADVQRVLDRLQKEPVAQVLVFSDAEVRTSK